MESLRLMFDGGMPFRVSPAVLLGLGVVVLWAVYRKIRLRQHRVNGVDESQQSKQTPPQEIVIEPLDGFDWKAIESRKLRPFKPIYHITMGLHSDPPSNLITVDHEYLDRVQLRRRLIAQHGAGVHGCVPGGEGAVRELYAYLLRDYLPVRFPTAFQTSKDGNMFRNKITGKEFPMAPSEDMSANLRTLGETVEEDLFLLHETAEGHRSVAFMCCFPSGFDPSAKLDKLLKDIHAPVPSYDKIGPSMERFFSKIQAGGNVKRTNWSIQTHDELFNCEGNHITNDNEDMSVDESIPVDQTFVRIELQTLSRLPQTRALLFSFKTYLYPIREIRDEGLGPQLADAIEGLKSGNAPGMTVYKKSVKWGPAACAYLRS